MRFLWVLLLAIVLNTASAQISYFPKGSLASDSRSNQFKLQWYSHALRAMQEPSLYSLASDPTKESYRFLWLRSFHRPITVRLDLKTNGTATLTVKTSSGAGGYPPGILIENRSLTLTQEQIAPFLSKLQALNFWKLPNPVDDQTGTDGSQWIIEGVKSERYHIVDRWSPRPGTPNYELGLLLLGLANEHIPAQEIY
jgi:hypothetical protein